MGFGGGTGGGPRRGVCSVAEGGGGGSCAVLAVAAADLFLSAASPFEPLSWSVSLQPGGGPIMTSGGSGGDAASLAYFSRSDRSNS